MAEFFSDGHRDTYLEALEVEKAGYQARLPKAKLGKDPASEAELADRVKQVDAEINRVKGIDEASSEHEFEGPKPVSKLNGKELDAQFGHVDGYPADGKTADKKTFAEEHLDERKEDNDGE